MDELHARRQANRLMRAKEHLAQNVSDVVIAVANLLDRGPVTAIDIEALQHWSDERCPCTPVAIMVVLLGVAEAADYTGDMLRESLPELVASIVTAEAL